MTPAAAWKLISHPGLVRMYLNGPRSLTPVEAALALIVSAEREEVERLRVELIENHGFFDEFARAFVPVRHERPAWPVWTEFVYLLVRLARPAVFCETGVFDGKSSAIILQALEDNGSGMLVSVDLPARATIENSTERMISSTLPPARDPGWAIPERLRHRQRLLLGDASELLPEFFAEFPAVDVFMHDSLHTYEHMSFEYSLAWQHLRAGGFLLSDDIFVASAFHDFCRARDLTYVAVGGFGATRREKS
jgi:Methyltransferase domain